MPRFPQLSSAFSLRLALTKHRKKIKPNASKYPQKIHPEASQNTPRGPQELPGAPLAPQACPQSAPRAPKIAPRRPQERPRSPQERPKSAQERPKSAQERPKSTQERPKSDQNVLRERPRCHQRGTFWCMFSFFYVCLCFSTFLCVFFMLMFKIRLLQTLGRPKVLELDG